MKYKALLFDVDGTLFNSNHEISKLTLEGIKKAYEKGIKIAVVTGRSPSGVKSVKDQLGFSVPFICSGGAIAFDNKGKIIYENALGGKNTKDVIDYVKSLKIDALWNVYANDKWYAEKLDDYRTRREEEILCTKAETIDVNLIPSINIDKVMFIATDDVISYLDIKLREEFKNFAIVRSQVIIVEVTANNVNKATAINSILDEWKLDKNEIIAFGDSNNDLEMLDYVGVGVAMGNASDNVKNQSDYVTLGNDSDGIYYALKHFGII